MSSPKPVGSRAALLHRLLDQMAESAKGRKLLSNILLDYTCRRVPIGYVREFVSGLLDLWEKRCREAGPNADFEPLVDELLDDRASGWRMRGRRVRLGRGQRISRVMTGRHFAINYLQPLTQGSIPDRLTREDVEELESGLQGRLRNATIPPSDPEHDSSGRIAWVTSTAELDDVRARHDAAELANAIRDLLGLFHLTDGYLVELRYPANFATRTNVRLLSPTFLDGEPHLVYRSHETPEGWGRTVNLRDLGAGLPEAVHPTVPIDRFFEIREIGQVSVTPPSIDLRRLCDGCPRPWEPSDKKLIDDLLQNRARSRSRSPRSADSDA